MRESQGLYEPHGRNESEATPHIGVGLMGRIPG